MCAALGVDSFGAGVCFSLLYLRLLAKSVEGMTGGGGGPSAPSILVPVLIFGIFRRWCAPPPSNGFFLYRVAYTTRS
jgi:hypothetical protein